MPIRLLGQMCHVSGALVHLLGSERLSSARQGQSQGCCMLGRFERRKVPRFCRWKECSVEAWGGLLPRGVSIHPKSWMVPVEHLPKSLEPKVCSLSSASIRDECSRTWGRKMFFLQGRYAESSAPKVDPLRSTPLALKELRFLSTRRQHQLTTYQSSYSVRLTSSSTDNDC